MTYKIVLNPIAPKDAQGMKDALEYAKKQLETEILLGANVAAVSREQEPRENGIPHGDEDVKKLRDEFADSKIGYIMNAMFQLADNIHEARTQGKIAPQVGLQVEEGQIRKMIEESEPQLPAIFRDRMTELYDTLLIVATAREPQMWDIVEKEYLKAKGSHGEVRTDQSPRR